MSLLLVDSEDGLRTGCHSPTGVLLRTPVTKMIIFNQGMILLGSNHFLVIEVSLLILFKMLLFVNAKFPQSVSLLNSELRSINCVIVL